MSNVEIGFAKQTDMTEIWQLYETVWLQTYPNEEAGIGVDDIATYLVWGKPNMIKSWQRAIKHPGSIDNYQRAVFVACDGDELAGVISPKVNDDGTHRLTSLYVAPEARGKDVGSKLIDRALEWHKGQDVYLFVAPYLENAQKLYKKYGFEFEEVPLTFFDNNPVPHLTMVLKRQS